MALDTAHDTPALAVEYNGECMGSLIESGAIIPMLPDEPIHPMDLVSVVLDGLSGPWARFVNAMSMEGYCGLVKIFLGQYEVQGELVYLFGQLNPPSMVPIPERDIQAMTKLDFGSEVTGQDLEAVGLLVPFAGLGLQVKKRTN